MTLRLFVLLAAAALPVLAAPRWELQFFHDEDESSLVLNDINFVTPNRGVAVGFLVVKGRPKPTALVTRDGGAKWTFVPTREAGTSLFFLDETSGWMITRSGIWRTEESGLSWRRIHKRQGLRRLHFSSALRGWAVGAGKTVLETRDGGKTWTKVPAVEQLKSSPENTAFTSISFADAKTGLIAGRSRASRASRFPLWMDPNPTSRPERPSLTLVLETRDGGETWTPQTSSVFGQVAELDLTGNGRGLILIEFEEYFRFPSELLQLDLKTGKNSSVLRRAERAITDIALQSSGGAFAAGFEPVGAIARSPVPGKVKILSSQDLQQWTEMPVDYRAVATRVSISALDAKNAWAVTDTGMVLRLRVD